MSPKHLPLHFLLVVSLVLGACARVPLPKIPSFSSDDEASTEVVDDRTATPRDLLGARLANPRINPDTPGMTVGKLIEFADRYLACDCAATRFVRAWEQTPEGYRLTTNSATVRPLDFVCREVASERECFLTEIDRGAQSPSFEERFIPGAEFIQFVYENGVRCEREEPCP